MQEFDLKIKDKKGIENVVAAHLSRLELENEEEVDGIPINETFCDEYLMSMQDVQKEPWYAYIVNFLAPTSILKVMSSQQRKKLYSKAKYYSWERAIFLSITGTKL